MDFDLTSWREAATGKLRGIGAWRDRQRREDSYWPAKAGVRVCNSVEIDQP